MKNKGVYIIAEAGVNHNGKLDLALKLANTAKTVGADAVKYQTFITDKIMTKDARTAEYQQNNCGSSSQFDMVRKLELTYQEFTQIKAYCDLIGIEFLSTPDEEDSLNFLVNDLKLQTIKVGSGEITNIPYLRKIGAMGQNVILSTGMSTLEEVELAIETLEISGARKITLLHCTTDYPANLKEVNLNAMLTLKDKFNKEVGYSDHTVGDEVAVAAVAMGAKVIEKHFTLDNNMEGPDHIASMNPYDFKNMVNKIRNVELALGDGDKKPSKSELKNMKMIRRSIVASSQIEKNEFFTQDNICCKRSTGGIPASDWDNILGKKAKRKFEEDELIEI